MDKKKATLLYQEHAEQGLSYRTLSRRYGISLSSVHRMVKKVKEEKQAKAKERTEDVPMPDDVKALQKELRRARLKIELLDAVIDIASEELGVDIRKKSGTRQS